MAGTAALGLSRELRTRPIRNRPRTSRWGRVEHKPVATSSTYVEPPRQAHSPRATSCRNYSFICTNLDVSTPAKAAAVEHWYRHRTVIENIFRDSKHGAALRHLPSADRNVNTCWMWASLIAAAAAGWLHQLTGLILGTDLIEGHGVRGGKAMIATLRRTVIAVPARLVRHGGQLIMRLPPGPQILPGILETIRALPAPG